MTDGAASGVVLRLLLVGFCCCDLDFNALLAENKVWCVLVEKVEEQLPG